MRKFTSVVVLFGLLLVLMQGVASADAYFDLPTWCAYESQDWDGATQTCTVDNSYRPSAGDAWVNAGQTLEIGAAETLVIDSGFELTIRSAGAGASIGTLINHGTIHSNGTIRLEGYAVLDNDGTINSSYRIASGGTIHNDGTINDDSPESVGFWSTLVIDNYGTINKNVGLLVNDGTLNNYGTIKNNATINNNTGDDEVIYNYGTFDNYGQFVNYGIVYNRGFVFLHPNVGGITNTGTATIYNYRCPGETGVITAQGNVENYGTIEHIVGQACP